jgi:hypothetical protein
MCCIKYEYEQRRVEAKPQKSYGQLMTLHAPVRLKAPPQINYGASIPGSHACSSFML